MLKRTIVLTNPASLRLKDNQVKIALRAEGEEERSVPKEEIGVVLVENQQVSITIPLLNALADDNVAVIFCNAKGLPHSMLQPLDANTTQGETLRLQIDTSEPLRKSLWKQIVETKIKNQSRLLDKWQRNGSLLKPHYTHVLIGDADNREGIAARIYWMELMGEDFVRDRDEEGINSLLNYGYAVLRAATARALVGSGLMPSLGLFHHNRSNPFPLADDIMEPFRPYVDDVVMQLCEEGRFTLDKETKQALVNVLYSDTQFDNVSRPLQVGLSMTTASLVKCYDKEITKLALPIF